MSDPQTSRTRRGFSMATGAALLGLVIGLSACAAADSSSVDKPEPAPPPAVTVTTTATASPTPLSALPDESASTPAQASDDLRSDGFVVILHDAAGQAVADPVTLTLAPPPAAPPPPPAQPVVPGGGATALCNDGSLSYSAHHQGTCSHHGGVAVWYK